MDGKKLILIGYEDTVLSYEALEWCIDFYSTKHDYKFKVIHVKHKQGGVAGGEEGIMTIDSITGIVKEICSRRISSVNNDDLPDVEVAVAEGDPTTVLRETAKKDKAYMLVVGGGYGIVGLSGTLKGLSLYDVTPCNLMVMTSIDEIRRRHASHDDRFKAQN